MMLLPASARRYVLSASPTRLIYHNSHHAPISIINRLYLMLAAPSQPAASHRSDGGKAQAFARLRTSAISQAWAFEDDDTLPDE